MYDSKKEVVQGIKEILLSPSLKSLEPEELAIIIYQNCVLPEIEKVKDQFVRLNYAHSPAAAASPRKRSNRGH